MRRRVITAVFLGLAVGAAAIEAQVAEQRTLTLGGAKRVVERAESKAREYGVGGAIAVVDAGGSILLVERLDTFAAAADIAVGKARTAALFGMPTSRFEEAINQGRPTMVALTDALKDFTPLRGGIPIEIDGHIVGAVGVSGASSAAQDEELALYGAEAAQSFGRATAGEAVYIDSGRVKSAFVKGAPLLEVNEFKVHASHRIRSGDAEIHQRETDIFYVLRGSATFVTGGEMMDARDTGPGEVRGAGLRGGTTHRLRQGDVIVIPAGTPHWFRDVRRTFDYYVVKVISNGGL